MDNEVIPTNDGKIMSIFECYPTLWVRLCIVGDSALGKLAPNLAKALDGMSIFVNGVNIINQSLFFLFCCFQRNEEDTQYKKTHRY